MRTDLQQILAAGPALPVFEVEAYHADSTSPVRLDVTRLELSWDEARAPRCQLRLDARAPDDIALTGLLDPRTPVRVHVRAGHRLNGVDDLETIARVGLRARRVKYPTRTMELDAAGDEALVIDAAAVAVTNTLSNATTTGAMTAILNQVFTSPTVNVTASAGGAVSLPAGTYTDRWATLEDLADQIGDVDVYDDGLGVWWITPRPTVAGTPDLSLTHGSNGTLIEVDDEVTREDWANYVYLRYEWMNGTTSNAIAASKALTTGPWAAAAGNYSIYTEVRERPATATTAGNAAASLLRRKASRGRNLRVRAVAVPWLRPGHTVALTLPAGDSQTALVSSVTLSSEGWMDLTTRLPDNATIG